MRNLLAVAGIGVWLGVLPVASHASDERSLSGNIGMIENGFWTRPVSNDLAIEDDALVITRWYQTTVEWLAEGVPLRSVTDTLTWSLPLDQIVAVRVEAVPGAVLLEGSDQDSYCPLTVAQFSCAEGAEGCDDQAQFYVCRYSAAELDSLLRRLQLHIPNMVISHATD